MPQNDDPVLDLHEIQGDVLVGLQKNFQKFIFLERIFGSRKTARGV